MKNIDEIDKVDIAQLKKDILIELRGDRTQAQINELLGRNFNQCAKWESGEKRLLWVELVEYLNVVNRDIRPMFVTPFRYLGDISDYSELIKFLSSQKKSIQVARELGLARDKVGRWYNLKQSPTFEEMFMIIRRYYPSRILDFIDGIASIQKLPSLYPIVKNVLMLKDYLVKKPSALALAWALELHDYKDQKSHTNGFLASKIGIDLEEEVEILKRLRELGVIRRNENKFELIQSMVHVAMKYRDTLPIRKYFIEEASKYMDRHQLQPRGCFMLYDIILVPEDKMRECIDSCFEFYQKLKNITVSSKKPKKNLRALNLNFFRLD